MKRGFTICFICFLLILIVINILKVKPEESNIISWYVDDIDGDDTDELLVITNENIGSSNTLETGEKHGDFFKIYSNFEVKKDKLNLIDEPDYIFDLTEIKPIKVQTGDINGDGKPEVSICVYKTAEFHQVLSKRPFFYSLEEGELVPIWLGSRLSRPFVDYTLFDIDDDNIDEIISIELQEDSSKIIVIYDWKGFGFEVKAVSESLNGEVGFNENKNRPNEKITIKTEKDNYEVTLESDEIKLIGLR